MQLFLPVFILQKKGGNQAGMNFWKINVTFDPSPEMT